MLTFIRWLLIVLAVIVVLGAAALVTGTLVALDWSRTHSNAVVELPKVPGTVTDGIVQIAVGEQVFRARVAGLGNHGSPVLLLHGFPETSAMWSPLLDALAAAGHRAVAFDQRGYSPLARPENLDDYRISHLLEDVHGVADALGWDTFHLIGHDWGSGVGWTAAMQTPDRLLSWTSLSIPHSVAFADALANDAEQQRRSRYFYLFRTPWLPEMLFAFNDFALMKQMYAPMSEAQKSEYIAVFSEPGAMTAALNWYRAMDESPGAPTFSARIEVPTLFIWGNQDVAVSRAAVDGQRRYFDGPFAEHELDAGHWLMEEVPDRIVPLVLEHLATVDAPPIPDINPEFTIDTEASNDETPPQ